MKSHWLVLAATIAVAGCERAAEAPAPDAAAPLPAPAVAPSSDAAPDPVLKAYLEAENRDAMAPLEYVAKTWGEGADQLTLVYLSGPEYCGSGGCNLLVLSRRGESYDSLGEVTVARPPIRILSTRTNGRPDIGVRVSGGGITEPYEARLAFDGARYPSNPTVAPAQQIDDAQGETLITDEDPRVTLKQ